MKTGVERVEVAKTKCHCVRGAPWYWTAGITKYGHSRTRAAAIAAAKRAAKGPKR